MTRSLRISCGSRLETKPLYVVLVLACWLGGRSVNAQTNSIIGRVVAAADSTPVPFAMLSFPKLKHEQFTDEFGRFILRDLKPGQLNMRVRRIGFVPFEADLPVRDGATDTVVVYLTQFAIRLAAVTVSEPPLCISPGRPSPDKDSVTTAVYEQLKLNAERARLLAEQHPYAYQMETKVAVVDVDGTERVIEVDTSTHLSTVTWAYAPGHVLRRRGSGQRHDHLNIPTLAQFADTTFENHHCFHVTGTTTTSDGLQVQMEIVAEERLRDPDVSGTILLDARTFAITKATLRLTKAASLREIASVEMITYFRDIMPSLPIISAVRGILTFKSKGKQAASIETKDVIAFTWLGNQPHTAKP
jgi:hypothetical protein